MKTRLFQKTVCLFMLASLLATSFGALSITFSGAAPGNVGIFSPPVEKLKSAKESPAGQAVRLWYDSDGELWVETPFYRWNISGGLSMTALGGHQKYEWNANPQRSKARVIDGLFFMAPATTPTTTRIFYALPDEAVVYLERKAVDGVEGLEMAFRASDGLIRFTHRWQGSNPPTISIPSQSPLVSNAAQVETQGGQLPARGTQSAGAWNYALSFDTAALQGQALIWQAGIEPAKITETSCFSAYPSIEPAAHDPCQFPNFFLPGQVFGAEYLFLYAADSSEALKPVNQIVSVLQLTAPDLNVANIERTPRYDYDAPKNNPVAGDSVTFQARVANRGGQATGEFGYAWYIDQTLVQSGTYLSSLAAGEMILLSLNWIWQDGIHTVRLEVDSSNTISEVSEQNNSVEDRTNGLSVGFWVEQSVYDYFNLHQVELGLGSVSWDDWAQRQIRIWNQMMADAVHPLTPDGILDRVRLDKVTVVPNGTLPHPYPGNRPSNDKTVDMMWGFDAELVGPSGFYIVDPSVQNFEPSLLHEMSHARYLLDLYGLDVGFGRDYLAGDVTSAATALTVNSNVETNNDWFLPAYLAVEGELIICQSKSGNSFTNCERGAEGTSPRAHGASKVVDMAAIRLQDGQGNLILASPALPLVGWWDDHVYYNRYPNDLMSGGLEYDTHSAYAWNRIAGQRPICGNQNAPCNIGEYANDLPQHNVVEIHGLSGQPIYGAKVEVFQAKPYIGWYAKLYLNTPDAVYYTDTLGRADLGHFPFGDGPEIIHGYGHSNANPLLKISYGDQSFYRFFEVTETNEAYWAGQHDIATYVLDTDIPYLCPTLTDWKGEYWNNESLTGTPVLCRNDANLDFEWDASSPDSSIASDHFSTRWTRDINFDTGIYTFEMFHDDGARLYIDNALVFENWCSDCRVTDTVTQPLLTGIHNIRYEMYDNLGAAAAKLTWIFAPWTSTLTVNKSGNGSGAITSSPAGINCGSTCAYTFPTNTVVTLTAVPATGSVFTGWSGGGCSGFAPCELPLTADTSVTATFCTDCGPANTAWPLYRQNSLHTGLSSLAGPTNPKVIWSFDAGSYDGSSPVIGTDGTIYVGLDHTLYAFSPNGSVKWSYTAGGLVKSPALAANGTIYAASDDGKLNAFSPNGILKWSFPTGGWISASPAIALDGTVYIGSADGKFYAISPDGTLKWDYTIGSWQNPSPAIGTDHTIYQGSTTWDIYALTPSGQLKWQYHTGCYVDDSIALGADGTLYVGSCDHALYALNPDGSLKWKYVTGARAGTAAIGADGTIYVGSEDHYLYAIHPDGTLKWRYLTAGVVITPSIDANGVIYAGSEDGYLYAINPSGSLKWRILLGGWPSGNPVIGPNQTVYMTYHGRIYAIRSTYALNVGKSGAGSGAITSNPAGINCGATCVYAFAFNTQVALTATPATGSIFTGWSGACAGVGACIVTMDSAKSVTANFSVQTPTQKTFYSTGASDGWMLESTETSNTGGTMDSKAATFNLGDAAADKQYRAILSFDTKGLPDNATIAKVILKIKRPVTGFLVGNNNPLTWGLGLKVDACKNFFGTAATLQLLDFNINNTTNCKLLAGTFGNTPTAYWYSANLLNTAFAKINKTGVTQFRLRFAKDDNDDKLADYLKFYSGDSTVMTNRPQLIITYTVP